MNTILDIVIALLIFFVIIGMAMAAFGLVLGLGMIVGICLLPFLPAFVWGFIQGLRGHNHEEVHHQ